MRRAAAAIAILLLSACSQQQADQAPTPKVLVSTQRIARGSVPEWLTAYGSAAPAINRSQTLSVPQPGQVTSLNVTPGAAIRAGQTLVVFRTAPSSLSTYQQAVTNLAATQKQRGTTAQLLTQQLATRDQLVQAEKAVADAQAAIAALTSEGAAQAVHVLTAPYDGIVTTVSVAQGDRTQPGAPLLTIARTGGIVATVGIDPAERARLAVGQPARLFRLNGGAPIPGRVIRVDSVLNPKTRQIDVDIAYPANAILPNEALRGEIAVGLVSGWLVPHSAVVTANGPTRIFQVAGGKARAVSVRLLLAGDPIDVVDGTPDPHRPLIVTGAYQVQPGDAVRLANR